MSRATQTIGAGFRALGGANMASFTLEFLSQSGSRRAGSTETIVVPYAEMGRDKSCAIRFDSSEKTVSRKHAAISSENGQYYITALSQTNQTLVNGAPINGKMPLNNGSEIQLSSSGPRMRFLASQTKTSTMRLTQRMQMFAAQSMRPYRTAVTILAIVLVASVSTMGYFLYESNAKMEVMVAKSKLSQEEFDKQMIAQKNNIQAQEDLEVSLKSLGKQLANTKAELAKQAKSNASRLSSSGMNDSIKAALASIEDDVYYVHMAKLTYRYKGKIQEYENIGSGTGFLLDDGKFVTALHVAEPWYFPESDEEYKLNAIKTQGGLCEITFVATSPSGQSFTFSSNNFNFDETTLESDIVIIGGNEYLVRVNNENTWGSDWAWIQTTKKGKIKADSFLSYNMEDNDNVYVMGYTFGLYSQPADKLNPLHSSMTIAQDGLTKGVIKVSGRSFDSGNSGGPAFAVNKKGELVNIGIVSHGKKVLGGIVPIGNIK